MLAWPSSPLPKKQKKQEDHLRSSCLSNSASNGQLLPSHRLSRVPSVSCAHTLSHSGVHSAKMTWPPRSWGTPMPACPALRPRRNPGTLAVLCQDVAFRRKHGVGFRSASFETQSHGLQTPCVRFAAWVTPGPRDTRFRLPAVSPP